MYGDQKRSVIIAYSASFVALIAVGSWFSIPFIPVPLTLQTLFVLLAGALMKRYGVIPVVLYTLLGAVNMPVFHNGLAGIGILLGPTGGYIIGFIPAAAIVGVAYEGRSAGRHALGLVAGTFVILICGAIWLQTSTGMPLVSAIIIGFIPFVAGDLLKASSVYLIAKRFS
jgi:biotin transport system substrate-specific component